MAEERNQNQSGGSNRGFGAMDPEKQREIASKGGRASHSGGNQGGNQGGNNRGDRE
jgi:uncharacterized protein